jgi:predicted nuclease of predicted toxin-antitoxin system
MGRPIRFLADQDFNEHIVQGVRRRDPRIEFLHVRDVGPPDLSDPDILEWAAQHGYLLVTHDVNTMTFHANARLRDGRPLAGLLLVHQLQPVAPVIESLLLIAGASEAEEWVDQVRFLPL